MPSTSRCQEFYRQLPPPPLHYLSSQKVLKWRRAGYLRDGWLKIAGFRKGQSPGSKDPSPQAEFSVKVQMIIV